MSSGSYPFVWHSQVYTEPSAILHKAVQAVSNEFKSNNINNAVKALTSDQKTVIRQAIINNDIETIYEILQDTAFDQSIIENYNQAVQRIAQDIESESKRRKLENDISRFLRQGYTFLAEFGELVRGSEILYEVTVTVENQGQIEKRTGYFSLKELLDYTYVEIHRGTYTLRLDTNKLKANHVQRFFSWSQQAYTSYNIIQSLGLNILPNINQGQLIEGFRDASDFILDISNELSGTLKENMIQKLKDAYSDRTRFFQGGDIIANIETMFNIFKEEEQQQIQNIVAQIITNFNQKKEIEVQEKGEGATFTALSTVLNNIQKAYNTLTKLSGLLRQQEKLRQQVGKTTAGLDKRIEAAAKKAVLQFLPKS